MSPFSLLSYLKVHAKGELYLVNTATLQKSDLELGYNPDAVDIAVDNEYVVVVNEFDYEDGDGGCDNLGFPGVSIYDIKNGIDKGSLVKDMKISHTGSNGNLEEPGLLR